MSERQPCSYNPAASLEIVPDEMKAAVAFLVWVDHAELLRRRPHLAAELTDVPHYEGDLHTDVDPSGGLGDGVSFSSLDEALAWARAAAKEVIVRPTWDPLVHYTATVGTPATWPRRD
jgi:hypothetical protein